MPSHNMMYQEQAIKVDTLSFSYNGMPVLSQVDFSVKKGEFIAIFGPNGGGKTTLLKLLMGFLKPQKGHISIFGHCCEEKRQFIGYVPQVAHFDKDFPISVLEVVLMGCLSHLSFFGTLPEKTKTQAKNALDRVGLLPLASRSFGSLSGGQAQRALIARALVSEPKLLLLDEPTASVDPTAEKEILEILGNLKGEMTILMVTHDLQSVVHQVDRLLCVRREVSSYLPSEVCDHFLLGLYHPRKET